MSPAPLFLSLLLTAGLASAAPAGPAPARGPAAAVATTAVPAAAVTGRGWRAPIVPTVVVRRFRPPKERWLSGHRGVDLRARPGAVVRAAGGGRVTYAADLAGRGVVVVDHGRLRTTYEPVTASVEIGARVRAGGPIGIVATGSGHCGDGRCLHLGLREGRTYLDPLLVIRPTTGLLRPW